MHKKIVIITTGQPSTNPRMIKEYTALKEVGYEVKVFYSFWAKWAVKTDEVLFQATNIKKEDFVLTGGSPLRGKPVYLISRILSKISRSSTFFYRMLYEFSLSRTTYFLRRAALNERADLYIAHNLGALPAAVAAAKKYKVKVGFDAEDFHRGELNNLDSKESLRAKAVENEFIPKCNYLTAASPLIAAAYKKLYPSKNTTVINNVFSKKYLQQRPSEQKENPLTLFWFSQTIGPLRGLETVITAIEQLKDKCAIELHLLGEISSKYAALLLSNSTPGIIYFISPVPPEEVFEIAAKFDVGLSVEVPESENRNICLTNKIFTYLLAGNCLICTNTKAQKAFFASYPEIGFIYDFGNPNELAEIFFELSNDRKKLQSAKINSAKIAAEIFNWEIESKKFLQVIKEV